MNLKQLEKLSSVWRTCPLKALIILRCVADNDDLRSIEIDQLVAMPYSVVVYCLGELRRHKLVKKMHTRGGYSLTALGKTIVKTQ